MKRRLTLSILLAVAAALLLAGVGTLVLARFGARKTLEDEVRGQAESTADLVAVGEQRLGQLNAADTQKLRQALCRGNSSQANPDLAEIRGTVCSAATSPVDAASVSVCDNLPARYEQSLSDDVRKARDDFCQAPTSDRLDAFRNAYCTAVDSGPITDIGPKRRAEQARRYVCNLVRQRSTVRENLQSALSKESIAMVTFSPDNALIEGDLPPGITAEALHPEQLRSNETVVGPVDAGFFAAAAVDPSAPTLSVIVISRPTDPARALFPWFLLASGVTLAIAVVVASSLSRKLTQPLRNATDVTARIADGDLSVRLPEHTIRPGTPKDELDALAHSINAMAEALERSRGLERQFLLSVSHDLRTPLTSIRGYAEAIADGATPDAPGAATIILAESRRLERLVKDLLDLAKLDARRFTFHIDGVDLNEIAGDSVDGFRRELEAAGLRLELREADGPVHVYTDPDRLQQVIANLVENALKFATTTVTVRVVADGVSPSIEIADDGPGIAAEDLPHVFERLYIAAARPRRKEAGSGLGLAIVRELVEAMGGHVTATPNERGGTSMVVHLPATPPPAPPNPPIESI